MLSHPVSQSPILLVCDVDLPDAHTRAGNNGQADGSGETLVTLGIIVLEANLEFDGFEEISLLGLKRVLKELLDVGTHSGCGAKLSVILFFLECRYEEGRGKSENIPTVIFDMMTVFQ